MRRLVTIIVIIVLLLAGWAAVQAVQGARQTEILPTVLTRPASAHGPYTVRDVVDGDTLHVLVDHAVATVRLIGIDTPETKKPDTPVQCYGPEASARTKQLVDGHQVWLEEDASQGLLDKYGRSLAYVWVDQILINDVLIRDGYAREYTYDTTYTYQARFRAEQTAAQAARRGLWSPSICSGTAMTSR